MSAEPTLPVSQPNFEPIAVDLARELYDRFVMGGWKPADVHAEIVLMLMRWYEGFSQERDRELQQARAQLRSSVVAERKDCEKALLSLSGARYPTPVEGYGTNTSWAISDLCRALSEAREEIARLKFDLRRAKKLLHPVPEKLKS